MFKKYEPKPTHTDLEERPYAPFSTDIMNAFGTESKSAYSTNPEKEKPETIIAANVKIVGELTFQNSIRIDGSFEGELISSGKLIVGPAASIKANIDLEEAVISGKVIGNITVKTRLVLRGKAEITGNITAPVISVDEGVSIIGQLNIVACTTQMEEPEC